MAILPESIARGTTWRRALALGSTLVVISSLLALQQNCVGRTGLGDAAASGSALTGDGLANVSAAADGGASGPPVTSLHPYRSYFSFLNFYDPADASRNPEVTPWILKSPDDSHRAVFVSTESTYTCWFNGNLIQDLQGETPVQNCVQQLVPHKLDPSHPVEAENLWRRNYHTVFSAHFLDVNNGSPARARRVLFTINHGELKDERLHGSCWYPPLNIGYGANGACPDGNAGWPSYNAFITMSHLETERFHLPYALSHPGDDHGPITWPSNGYLESTGAGGFMKATHGGIRHPSSLVFGGYLYVLYEDLSLGREEDGRGPGIKVIRAPLTSDGVDPHSFRAYFNGEFSEPTLPAGFDKTRAHDFWLQKGGRSTNVLGPGILDGPIPPPPHTGRAGPYLVGRVFSFSVAKVRGQDLFVGVGLDSSKGTTLQFSKNLVTWSEPWTVPGTAPQADANGRLDWEHYGFLYPRLLDQSASTNTEIDTERFYLAGMTIGQDSAGIARKKMVLQPLQLNPVLGRLFRISGRSEIYLMHAGNHCSMGSLEDFRRFTGLQDPQWVPPVPTAPPGAGNYGGICRG